MLVFGVAFSDSRFVRRGADGVPKLDDLRPSLCPRPPRTRRDLFVWSQTIIFGTPLRKLSRQVSGSRGCSFKVRQLKLLNLEVMNLDGTLYLIVRNNNFSSIPAMSHRKQCIGILSSM